MIIISPFSRKMRNGTKKNPKDYPYWNELIQMILEKYPEQKIIQIGINGEEILNNTEVMFNKTLDELKELLKQCDYWISVDNFFHHLAVFVGKKGIVLFGQSDPEIFGHKENINILKGREYLRPDQFNYWEARTFDENVFVKPYEIMTIIETIFNQ